MTSMRIDPDPSDDGFGAIGVAAQRGAPAAGGGAAGTDPLTLLLSAASKVADTALQEAWRATSGSEAADGGLGTQNIASYVAVEEGGAESLAPGVAAGVISI